MIDPRQLNIRDSDGRLLCPCCGFPDYSNAPAYLESGGLAGVTICPCCLWEPGFDDCPLSTRKAVDDIITNLRRYRAEWGHGMPFRGKPEYRPANFDGRAQLLALMTRAPHLG